MAKIEEVLPALAHGHRLAHPQSTSLITDAAQLATAVSVVGLTSAEWTIVWSQPTVAATDTDYVKQAAAGVAKMDNITLAEYGKRISSLLFEASEVPPECPSDMTSEDYRELVRSLMSDKT